MKESHDEERAIHIGLGPYADGGDGLQEGITQRRGGRRVLT